MCMQRSFHFHREFILTDMTARSESTHDLALARFLQPDHLLCLVRVSIGVMGVAPPPEEQLEAGRPLGVVSTGPPNINGGNMDHRHMCEGSIAYVH